jgi:predicted NUDIX family NTP pyrophosphohydrolase
MLVGRELAGTWSAQPYVLRVRRRTPTAREDHALVESAGTMLYRRAFDTGEWQVLLVCPSGPAARYGWSLPKGLPDAGESLEAAARRETFEETSCVAGVLVPLGVATYRKSRKRVHAFAGPAAADAAPKPSSWEVSTARFVSLAEASRLLHVDQAPLVSLLATHLAAL